MNYKISSFQEYERFLKWKLELVNRHIVDFALKIKKNIPVNNKELLQLKQIINSKPFYLERIKTLNCNKITNFYDFILNDIFNYKNKNIDLYNEIINMIELELNNQDESGLTLLHKSIKNKDMNKLEKLIMLGANLDIKDNSGKTPLYYSCKKANYEFVKILIENKCIIDNNTLDFLKNREPIMITVANYNNAHKIYEIEDNFYLINEIVKNNQIKNINFEIKKFSKMQEVESASDTLEYFKDEINLSDLQDTSSLTVCKPNISKI